MAKLTENQIYTLRKVENGQRLVIQQTSRGQDIFWWQGARTCRNGLGLFKAGLLETTFDPADHPAGTCITLQLTEKGREALANV